MGRCRLVGGRQGRSLEARRGERRPQTAGRPDDPALDTLIRAVAAHDPARARQAALQVEQAALDLQLRHRPPAGVDLDGMDLWARQLLVDAAAKDRGAIAGDAATLRVLWDRAGHSVHTTDPTPPSGSAPRCGPLARRRTGMDLRRQLRGSRPFELRCRHEGPVPIQLRSQVEARSPLRRHPADRGHRETGAEA
jgi:hypothetical protein